MMIEQVTTGFSTSIMGLDDTLAFYVTTPVQIPKRHHNIINTEAGANPEQNQV